MLKDYDVEEIRTSWMDGSPKVTQVVKVKIQDLGFVAEFEKSVSGNVRGIELLDSVLEDLLEENDGVITLKQGDEEYDIDWCDSGELKCYVTMFEIISVSFGK